MYVKNVSDFCVHVITHKTKNTIYAFFSLIVQKSLLKHKSWYMMLNSVKIGRITHLNAIYKENVKSNKL